MNGHKVDPDQVKQNLQKPLDFLIGHHFNGAAGLVFNGEPSPLDGCTGPR